MKKLFTVMLCYIFFIACTAENKEVRAYENSLLQPVTDENDLALARHIKDCTPFVQVNTGATNKYGTVATKLLITGFDGNKCNYKFFVNGKLDYECGFPKSVLPGLADTSSQRKFWDNWSLTQMKYCKFYDRSKNTGSGIRNNFTLDKNL